MPHIDHPRADLSQPHPPPSRPPLRTTALPSDAAQSHVPGQEAAAAGRDVRPLRRRRPVVLLVTPGTAVPRRRRILAGGGRGDLVDGVGPCGAGEALHVRSPGRRRGGGRRRRERGRGRPSGALHPGGARPDLPPRGRRRRCRIGNDRRGILLARWWRSRGGRGRWRGRRGRGRGGARVSALSEVVQAARAVLPEAVHLPALPRPRLGPRHGQGGGDGDAVHALRDAATRAQVHLSGDGGWREGGGWGVCGGLRGCGIRRCCVYVAFRRRHRFCFFTQ